MILRDYQQWAVDAIWRYFETNTGNPVVAMPTGTGKSLVIAGLIQRMLYAFPQTRVMIATHVKELIAQNYDKFVRVWPNAPAGIFSAGLNKREFHQPITFCGIASVVKRAAQFGHIDILLVDECDLIGPDAKSMYKRFIADLKTANPYLKVCGLTATPWRAGIGMLDSEEGGLFTDTPVDMTGIDPFNWFLDQGYLVPLIPKKTTLELKTDGVHLQGGEFKQSELQIAVDKQAITEKALSETIQLAEGRRKWLTFASGVDHAKHIADMLTDMGVPSKAVFSGMATGDRTRALAEHREGAIRAIVNNNILTTGYDDDQIDLILMLRPTMSARLWVQMLGRGTRPWFMPGYDLTTQAGRLASISASPKWNTFVLDFAGNTKRLGAINNPQIPNKKGTRAGKAPVKLCTTCDVWNHASARYCGGKPYPTTMGCGTEFTFVTKLKVEASTEKLIVGEFPKTETFKVDHITYGLHTKVGKPDAFKVTYYCGLTSFTEFVCPEHQNYAGVKAREWWRQRTKITMPLSTEECLELVQQLPAATHLRVWVNKKPYPEITSVCFDGTAFGTLPPTSVVNTDPPKTQLVHYQPRVAPSKPIDDDADIPDITKKHESAKWDSGFKWKDHKRVSADNWEDDDIPF